MKKAIISFGDFFQGLLIGVIIGAVLVVAAVQLEYFTLPLF
jgi:gas vesicle protein